MPRCKKSACIVNIGHSNQAIRLKTLMRIVNIGINGLSGGKHRLGHGHASIGGKKQMIDLEEFFKQVTDWQEREFPKDSIENQYNKVIEGLNELDD